METLPSLSRIEGLIGEAGITRLQQTHLLVIGLGAVGGAAVEALARSGIGTLTLVDGDTFDISNLNRQPFATQSVVGQPKAPRTADALKDLAPTCTTHAIQQFITPENIDALLDAVQPQAVLDAIDDLPAKMALLTTCVKRNLPIWSAMGAARKRHPEALRVTDISKTEVCPLARTLRQGLRKAGIHKGIRCVWSNEIPSPHQPGTLGSFMPVTATAGLLLAADLIEHLLKN
jgi:tRNA A37 threonylcarbamoyladenosine dehydratase